MQRILAIIIALLAWFAVITQLVLMLENRELGIGETLVSFLSFFTILTNTLVALFFTGRLLHIRITQKAGKLTAVTSYILIVGLVYQFLLRHLWQPTGLQWVVDELLHTVVPILVTIYWYLYEEKPAIHYKQIPGWLIYPLVYFVYILVRGMISYNYPYPFIDASQLGMGRALLNGVLILVFFVVIQILLIMFATRKVKLKRR
ncbi:hypothetical protein A4D02_25100 [Niastella koreensis]|uniref:Integral membrane protein n=2 Tax=Niastella koreensis TaxID=354356 RepID=G8TPZ9_NIAKG|nr:Pr6Pr family membrane protein [Niastella koreensis]AEV99993.1 hypothetical protein Niako_3695 [Niastella koreensis GR20-10]OQP51405.1 hypothetical protein A4D02_25100 [Niastella koreensis]